MRAAHELSQTQLALAGAAGVTTYLVRPPYSSHANAVDDVAWKSITHASEQGYVTVLSDTDSRDWRRTGVADIIRDATPPDDGRGAIILLHDGFGDRSQTAAALDQLIPQLKAKGYRFTTVSEGLGFPPANQPADPMQRLRGEVLIGAVTVSTFILLNLILSCLAAMQGAILLIAAKRADQISSELASHDYETNVEADKLVHDLLGLTREIHGAVVGQTKA